MKLKISVTKRLAQALLALIMLSNVGCATVDTKKMILGMVGGGAVGAFVGHDFVRAGPQHENQLQNTIVSAAIGALLVGGFLAWHYDQMQEQTVAISAQYSRYRLCNPDEMPPEMVRKMGLSGQGDGEVVSVKQNQVEPLAIHLDDNTKWAYPVFRKRTLAPERGENQVVSDRYVWEIMRPGSFVTRTQDPQYFVEPIPSEKAGGK